MFRVLIWDYTGESSKWCETHLDKNTVELVQTITPAEIVPKILLQKNMWDWLLIFERNMRISFETTAKTLKLPLEKIIYALDGKSWVKHPKAINTLLNDGGGGIS